MNDEKREHIFCVFRYLSYELHGNLVIKRNLWDPMLCVVTSNSKPFHFSFFLFSHLLLLSFHPLHLQRFFLFLFLFFLPFFTSIASSFFLSFLFSSLHTDASVGFLVFFLWVYLFLYQWVLFGLMQRRERQWLDFWVSNLSLLKDLLVIWVFNLSLASFSKILTRVNHHVWLWMFQHHGFVDSNGKIGGTRVVFCVMVWYYELGF